MNADGKIAVWVTAEQRLFLEFVVARFANDTEQLRRDPRLCSHNPKHVGNCDAATKTCRELITELRQAGT